MKSTQTSGTTYFDTDGNFIVDFGTFKRGQKTEVEVDFGDVTNLSVHPTCGCISSITDKNKTKLEYKTVNNLGLFSKVVKVNYTEKGKKENKIIKLKGNIVA